MQRIRRLSVGVWVLLLIAALTVPALGPSGLATAAQPVMVGEDSGALSAEEYAHWLRTRVPQAQIETRIATTNAWLEEWMATERTERPAVDPELQSQTTAQWTVMVFVAADNNLEIAGLSDINEMEAVGSSPDVNIVAEIDRSAEYTDWDGDWTEGRRYYIQQDDDLDYINSPVMENLGEVNSGSAEAVADFAIWGITNYPAEKYMLVLWDHGGAWISHASDEESGDDITLPELTAALDRVKTETGVDKFEVLGFDMCLMGQLEVYQAIAPYAYYGIGSEENEPGAGWFYVFLEELVNDPSMRGDQVVRHVVDYFMYFLDEVLGDRDVYGLGGVDLGKIDVMTGAVDQFSAAARANPGAVLSPIADARNNTISYGGFNDPQTQDFWSSVDLYEFSDLLAGLTANQDLAAAAEGVKTAVGEFVVYEQHVDALEGSHGVSIYFPKNPKVYTYFSKRYAAEISPNMAQWAEFLNTYHNTSPELVPNAPTLEIVGTYPEVASIHEPAVILLEVAGRDIMQVNYAVGYFVDGDPNQRVVLDFDYLVSRTTTASGADIVDWSDGVTTRTFAWEAEVPVLTDGSTETYALVIPNRDNPDVGLVNGFYQSVRGGDEVQAQMLFDLETQDATAVWGVNETTSGNLQPFELQVEAGDTFTPEWLTLDGDNQLSGASRGDTLTLSADIVGVTFEKVPAPSGQYSISFVAENVAGETTLSESIITVNNEGLDASLRGYTDLSYGVNFLYPAHWLRPRFTPDGTRLFTGNDPIGLFMTLYPYTNVASAEDTDAAIRESWNALENFQLGQQQAVEINGLPAFVSDYTYSYSGINRIGLVIAIYVPDQGVGYAFDIDAPVEAREEAEFALRALVDSISFFDAQTEVGSSAWQTAVLADGLVSFPVPATWGQEVSGGWTVYGPAADENTFVALGAGPASGMTDADMAQGWVDQLQASVQNFEILASEPFYIGGREWHVVVFTYNNGVAIGGAFFTTSVSNQDIVFWIEAPNDQFDALYDDVFSVILGGFEFGG